MDLNKEIEEIKKKIKELNQIKPGKQVGQEKYGRNILNKDGI